MAGEYTVHPWVPREYTAHPWEPQSRNASGGALPEYRKSAPRRFAEVHDSQSQKT